MKAAGLIGAGLVGTKRAHALTRLGVPVSAVFDLDGSRAEALVSELPSGPRVVCAPDDVWADDDVDVVIVATTHDMLSDLAQAAVRAGRNVLVEKPGARTRLELEPLAAEARARGLVARIGYNHRFHPAVLALRDHVRSGEFGRILNMRAHYGHGGRLGYETEWRADPARSGGGELLDQGSHLIDLTRFFVGDVELRFAELSTDFWAMPVEDNVFLALRARSGPFAWLHASWTEWKNTFVLEMAFERARVDLFGLGGSYGEERMTAHRMRPELGPPDSAVSTWPASDESWERELEDLRLQLDGHEPVGATVDDGLAALALIDTAYGR